VVVRDFHRRILQYLFLFVEPTDWNSAIQELLEKQGVDIRSEMEKK